MSDRLHIRWSGLTDDDAPTIVLLHGVTNSGALWADAVERWSGIYRIAAIDALGHGESDRFTDEELAGEGADLAAGAIEALVTTTISALEQITAASGQVLLYGHSMGGATASVVAMRRPDMMRGTVLEDPAWPITSPEKMARRGAAWVAAAVQDRADPAPAIARELNDPDQAWPLSELEPWVLAHGQQDDRFVILGRTEMREPWREIAAALAVPTLVVTGTEGVIIDEGIQQQLAEIANPNLEVAVIDGAGHSVRRDRSDAFHAVVDPWIAQRFA